VSKGVDVSGIRVFEDEVTPSCHITTDKADNQITGFHMGAMSRATELQIGEFLQPDVRYCIVSPDEPTAMLNHCAAAKAAGHKVLFDPSFQVTAMGGSDLLKGTSGSYALVLNDYEFAVFCEKTGLNQESLLAEHVEMLIVTLGDKGSLIHTRGGESYTIPTARPESVVDPTGAGDAYRGGLLAGLLRGLDLETCGRMGSVASAYAIEKHGTQQHSYTQEEFAARYADNFGATLALAR
jgi:adenosine kinase